MKQLGLCDHGFAKKHKITRRERFLNEMEAVMPWARLAAVIAPYYPAGSHGRRPFPLATMLRIHFLQQ